MAAEILTKGQKHDFCSSNGALKCSPEFYFEPENITEIRQILAAACFNKKCVKVIGVGQSLSPLNTTEGYMICLKNMSMIIQVDPSMSTVVAEAGITISELSRHLKRHGMALQVLPSDVDSTLGGAVSCGDVGLGEGHSSLSDCVMELELVTAGGEVMTLSRAEGQDVFRAACLSLGALGVITKVKVQCEPSVHVRRVTHGLALQQVLENLSVHTTASDDFSFDWYPHTDAAVVSHVRTTDSSTKNSSGSVSWFWNVLIGYYQRSIRDPLLAYCYYLLHLLLFISTYYHPLISRVENIFYRLRSKRQEITGVQYHMAAQHHSRLPSRDELWTIPKDKTSLVLFEIQEWINKNNFPAHFPIAIRFSEADDILRSHSFKMASSYIRIPTLRVYGRSPDHSLLYDAVSQIALGAGGRIHWSNINHTTYPYDEVHEMFPALKLFLTIRKKMDPEGIFLNRFLTKLFGIE